MTIPATSWIRQFTEALVIETTESMIGVPLRRTDSPARTEEMDAICARTEGAFQLRIVLRAQHSVFERMRQYMNEMDPLTEYACDECAMEYFNVLCGRFISEIHRMSKTQARFFPTEFEPAGQFTYMDGEEGLEILHFSTEQGETVEFIWTKKPFEDYMRRNNNGEA